MKKKILAIALVAVLAVVAVTGASLAYFTDEEEATNVITVGNVNIDLTEPKWDEDGKDEAKEVYPGEALAKDPTVKNIGNNPCFVRISVTGWDALVNADLAKSNITFRTDYEDGKLGDGWEEYEGYYYYTEVLEKDKTTDALFDQIVVPTDLTNGNAMAEYKLIVTAEAVQAQGAKPSFADVQNMTVEEIAAWFAVCLPAD